MSIKEMIKEHPQVGADWNEELGEAVKHAMYCAAICTSCADACSAEEMDMRTCIRLCMDCADICSATTRVASRRTSGNVGVIESMLRTCIAACEACAEECEKHDTDHCRRCARMCRECADDCTKALEGMQQHA
jgi:hypothetical protein